MGECECGSGYKWNVNELASNINVSTRQFQRLMQTNYGFTAEKMLRKLEWIMQENS